MKQELCLFLPYFGRFPNYFEKWVQSAKKNDWVDFFVLSDNCESHVDNNIHYVKMSLEEIRARIEKTVGYQVHLKSPYKLCDYKPAYGEIFSDLTAGYRFWGYVDSDIVFGNLRLLFTPEKMEKFEFLGGGGVAVCHQKYGLFK